MMQLKEGFKQYVIHKKDENDLERHRHGQKPYKNLFSYYRATRQFLADRYYNNRGKQPWENYEQTTEV